MDSKTQQVAVRLTPEQVKRLDEIRASERPIPSLAEIVRRAVEQYLKANN